MCTFVINLRGNFTPSQHNMNKYLYWQVSASNAALKTLKTFNK